jgi:hypothetical protein
MISSERMPRFSSSLRIVARDRRGRRTLDQRRQALALPWVGELGDDLGGTQHIGFGLGGQVTRPARVDLCRARERDQHREQEVLSGVVDRGEVRQIARSEQDGAEQERRRRRSGGRRVGVPSAPRVCRAQSVSPQKSPSFT